MRNLDELKDMNVVGFVEATSYEILCLWGKYNKTHEWKQDPVGFMEAICIVYDRPICVSFSLITLNGKNVCFFDAVSQLVDHSVIDEWFKDNFPGVKRVDAMNFHIIIEK